jgi:type II secretory pathway component GspD/PulD (secretin)
MKANRGLTVLLASGLGLAHATAASQDETSLPAGTNLVAAVVGFTSPTNGLLLNLRGVPLSQVLEHLGRAAGLVIHQNADLKGNVTVWNEAPLEKEETVKVLYAVLKHSGYSVLRDGRTLTVLSPEQVKTADLKVVCGSDPDAVEPSDEVSLQLIPVRYASASQLLNNLQVLLPTTATLSANESANTLLLVATQSEIRRVLSIVKALDNSLSTACSLRVFALHNGDAKELATVLQQLFSSGSQDQSAATSSQQGGPGFGMGPGGGFFGGPGGPPGAPGQATPQTTSSSTSGSASKAKVTIVADERSNSLVVSAPADRFDTLERVINECDQQVAETTVLRRFRLRNADPTELADQLAQLFPSSSNGSDQNQSNPTVTGGPPMPPMFGGGVSDSTADSTSTHRRTQSQVQAVADPRTSSLLVSAATSLMPQIAKLIDQLDDSPGRKEVVRTFDLRYADPQDVYQALQDLFNRNTAARTSNNRNSLLGQSNPLSTRETQQQSSSTFGTSASQGGAGSSSGASSAGAAQ